MPAVDATSTASGSEVTSLSLNHTASGSNRYVLIGIYTNSEVSVTATYGGMSCSLIAVVGEYSELRLFGIIAPATGSQSVVATFSGMSTASAMGVISFTDVHQVSPYRDADSTYLEGASISLTLDSSGTDLVVDVASGVTDAITADAAQTRRVTLDNFEEGFRSLGMSTRTGAGATTAMTWTAGSTALQQIAVSLVAAGGASGIPRFMNIYSRRRRAA